MIKRDKYKIAILLPLIIVGFLFIKQVNNIIGNKDIVSAEDEKKIAYEIIEVSNSNFQLQNELNNLRLKNDSFSFDIKDKNKTKEELKSKIEDYKTINGLNSISGRGIEIIVDGNILTEEIIDLINGIRNTKPDAIGINGKRIIYSSYFIVDNNQLEFDGNKISLPFSVQVLGDTENLRKSIDRSGGILEVLKNNSFNKIKFTIENKDSLSLPAHDSKIELRYAKIIK